MRRRAERSRLAVLEGAAAAAVTSALDSVRAIDGERLERDLLRSAVHAGRGVFLEQIAVPLMKQVGDEWHAGLLGVAQEHLATATLHRAISWLLGATSGRESGGGRSCGGALREIRTMVDARIPVVVGGAAASSYGPVLREIEASQVPDLGRFRDYLRERSEAELVGRSGRGL